MWFSKKITIFKRKDKNTWLKIKSVLKDSGLKGVRAGHYSAETLCACGCGSKLDPRNFGKNGYIDRDIYFVDVRKNDVAVAKNILSENGIESVIDDDPVGKLGRMI